MVAFETPYLGFESRTDYVFSVCMELKKKFPRKLHYSPNVYLLVFCRVGHHAVGIFLVVASIVFFGIKKLLT